MKKSISIMALGLFLSGATQANPNILQGSAYVLDGDTLEIQKTRVRLAGIDAPEKAQTCQTGSQTWFCGQASSWALDQKTQGKTVQCQLQSKDQYGRWVAECFVNGVSLNASQVQEGWAIAYERFSKAYLPQQQWAKQNKQGIWSGTWMTPEQFRKEEKK